MRGGCLIVTALGLAAVTGCGREPPTTEPVATPGTMAAAVAAPATTVALTEVRSVGGAAATPAVEPRFSAVRRVVVGGPNGFGKKGDVLLCLRTGEAVDAPDAKMTNADRAKLTEGKKIDAFVFSSEPDYLVSLPTSEPCVVVGKDVDAGAWETMTPAQVLATIEAATHDPKSSVGTTSDNTRPVVFVFRSKELVSGIMRLMGKESATEHEVEIQMKVVER